MDKYIELDFAKLDTDRVKRRGYSEAVFCECKNDEQLIKIFQRNIGGKSENTDISYLYQ